jgi:hypothetical protein
MASGNLGRVAARREHVLHSPLPAALVCRRNVRVLPLHECLFGTKRTIEEVERVYGAVATITVLSGISQIARAQVYPTRPIHLCRAGVEEDATGQ